MSEKSGHRDINGNWVDETPQAKLRNKLTPFWTLSSIIAEEGYDKTNPDIIDMITRLSTFYNVNNFFLLFKTCLSKKKTTEDYSVVLVD